MDKVIKMMGAAIGAVVSFFAGMPPLLGVLLGVMTMDYITGLMCAAAGVSHKTESGKLASGPAYAGLLKKAMILMVVALGAMLDYAVAMTAVIEFSAVTGAVCAWFIASEGLSILENAALLGVSVPKVLTQMLDVMHGEKDGA